MRVLITGITGFAGSHLADYILDDFPWIEIFGTWHWRSRTENIEHLKNAVTLIECDLKDQSSIAQTINKIKPNVLPEVFAVCKAKCPKAPVLYTQSEMIVLSLAAASNLNQQEIVNSDKPFK